MLLRLGIGLFSKLCECRGIAVMILCVLLTLQTFERKGHKGDCIEQILCIELIPEGITCFPGSVALGGMHQREMYLAEMWQNETNLRP